MAGDGNIDIDFVGETGGDGEEACGEGGGSVGGNGA